jgi:hypothetical protein
LTVQENNYEKYQVDYAKTKKGFIMEKAKSLFAVLLAVIIGAIFAGCGDNSKSGGVGITTTSLPGATVGTAYSQTLTASGGTGSLTWSITAGAPPASLSLNAATGTISGTPTRAGTANFTVMVTDSASPAGTATKALSIVVTAPAAAALAVTTTSLPGATIVGGGTTVYSQALAASGGSLPYIWSISTGVLPAGLSLNAGVIAGNPTTTAVSSNFTVMVTDSASPAGTATQPLSIAVTFDGLAYYNTVCLGCHNTLGVRSAADITSAIATVGAMSQFGPTGSTPLTAAQINAIAAASH